MTTSNVIPFPMMGIDRSVHTCPQCGGSGEGETVELDFTCEYIDTMRPCELCNGEGSVDRATAEQFEDEAE